MALIRWGRGWSETELRSYLEALQERTVNFDTPVEEMTAAHGWTVDGSDDVLGTEEHGAPQPDGIFERARQGLMNYDFSEPHLVEGHFDPQDPFIGRNMLLEIKFLGLRNLCGVRVHSVREERTEEGHEEHTIFGFRYDTLEGHIERGYEWFLLTKNHHSGQIRFKIEAHWRLGQFPNWWTRVGFALVGQPCRMVWRHLAPRRLKKLTRKPAQKVVAPPGELAHRGDPEPTRTRNGGAE